MGEIDIVGKQDDGCRALFRNMFPEFHWNAIETWALQAGVPDAEYCTPDGVSGWVEFKAFGKNGEKPTLRPAQIGWIDRRLRHKGNVHIFIKKERELYYCDPRDSRQMLEKMIGPLTKDQIREILVRAEG